MNPYGSGADDFYVNMQLQTALDLPQQRETLMHFFEQVQRRFPRMDSLSVRDKEIYLEEDKENSTSRWVSTDMKRVSAGIINPPSLEEAWLCIKPCYRSSPTLYPSVTSIARPSTSCSASISPAWKITINCSLMSWGCQRLLKAPWNSMVSNAWGTSLRSSSASMQMSRSMPGLASNSLPYPTSRW